MQAIFESHSAGNIDLQVAVQLAVVARFYERIGDHAVNIGERVRYVVTGWMPEHKGAARYRSRSDDTGQTLRPNPAALGSAIDDAVHASDEPAQPAGPDGDASDEGAGGV